MDLVVALLGIVVLLPVFFVIAVIIWADSPREPVLFRQQRVGRYGKTFFIRKFRTMRTDGGASGAQVTATNDSRITSVGRWLRDYKLDELPQLLNVLVGEMSLVGPRPEVPKFVELYPEEIRREVLSVRPGITDYAAIEFRNENQILDGSFDPEKKYVDDVLPKKLELYRKYVREHSLLVDISLIVRTLLCVIGSKQ